MVHTDNDYLGRIAQYCRDELNIEHNLEINVALTCLKEDGALGWCYDLHDNEIDIELDKWQDEKSMGITLCHEMVHAKQFAMGLKPNEDEAVGLEQILYDGFIKL
jgi:hypothetical protein